MDIDLFAGAGGLAVGLEEAGFSPARLYELDKYACRTLRANQSSATPTLCGSVEEIDVHDARWEQLKEPVRLLAAGAPCQPFSLGGKHLADQDGRNLFPEVFRAVRALHPRTVLLENVRGLARPSFRPYFEYILRQLRYPSVKPHHNELWQDHDARLMKHERAHKDPEYHVTWAAVDAANYGVPQNRLRVFIVGTQPDLPRYEFPPPTHSKEALLREQATGCYWERHKLRKPKHTVKPAPDDDARLPWATVRDALRDLPAPAHYEADAAMNHWLVPGARSYTGHSGSRQDWPSKTIKAGVHGVPGGENVLINDNGAVRYYTLRETARLQSFPDEHIFEGARLHVTRQIGNAVPCKLASAIALPLNKLLGKEPPR